MLFGFILSSCEIDSSINVDPNAIAEENVKSIDGINSLLIGLQVNAGDTYSRDRSRIFSMFSWQMCAPPGIARAQPVAWNEYFLTTDGPVDDYWVITYRGVRIANDIISFTPDVFKDNPEYGNAIMGMAYAYKAMLLGEAAATYGSIPIEIVGTTPPEMVDQPTAYAYVQTTLDKALAAFNAGTAAVSRDLNFGGDAAKWIAVCNSLKARFYLHLGDYTNAYMYSALGISSADGSLYSFYSSAAGEQAQWGLWAIDEQETLRGEKYFVDLLKSEEGDTRLSTYFSPNSDGEYLGFAIHDESLYPNAVDPLELDFANTVRMKKYSTYSESFPLFRLEENAMIFAEAAAKTGKTVEAATALNLLRAQNGLGTYNGSDLVGEILKQKYLELYLEGQCWHDMRRTGKIPALPNGDASLSSSSSLLRFLYPQSEKNANPNLLDYIDANGDDASLCKWVLSTKYTKAGGMINQ